MQNTSFFYKKSYLQRALLLALVLLALGIYFVMTSPATQLWMVVIFSAFIATYALKSARFVGEMIAPRPVIEISAQGVLDRKSIGRLPLPWDVIEEVVLIPRPKGIALVTNDTPRQTSAETLLSRFSNMMRKKLGRKGSAFLLTPVTSLETDFDKLLEALRTHNTNKSLSIDP